MNKPVYAGLSILEISKTLMYEFWYGYRQLIVHAKTKDVDEEIVNDVEKRFDTSNY